MLRGPDFRISLKEKQRVLVLAAGKAAGAMAQAVSGILRPRSLKGLAVIPCRGKSPQMPLRILRGAHPVPQAASYRAGSLFLEEMANLGPQDIVIHLISGGASAMVAAPLPQLVSRRQKSHIHRLLIDSGLGIREINVVRKHFSDIKGGRLAARAPATRQVSLVWSDVPVDLPDAVGSGPTLPDSSTWDECIEILRVSGLLSELPASIRRSLRDEKWPETPKPKDPVFRRSLFHVAADCRDLVEAASRRAQAMGYATRILRGTVEDSPEEFLERMLQEADSWKHASRPRCLLASGEAKIRVVGRGVGGRAQDLALAAALRLEGRRGVSFFAAGSDGIDGNSPAAGAFCDGRTILRARRRGLNPRQIRAESDAFSLFRRLGDCLVTGTTGNNLRDLYVLMEAGAESGQRR